VPVDRTLGTDLAGSIIELYGDLEQRLAALIARELRAGIEASDQVQQSLTAIATLRRAGQRMLGAIETDLSGTVEQAVVLAYHRGGEAAVAELVKRGTLTAAEVAQMRSALPQLGAIQRLVYALTSKLLGTHVRILRWELDAYREVIAKTIATGTLVGRETRLRTAQRAWEELLARGITGFTDKAGRNWQLASYVEMATRTGTAQAAVQGNLDRLGAAGIDLVVVSDAPQECKRCRPWEGKVLARTGPGARTVQALHGTQDRQVAVKVAGSVLEAVEAGLMHPNCRHSLSAYLPGVTRLPTDTADPDGDIARQKLRALERKVRKAKLQAAGALDPAAKKRFEGDVRAAQAEIREHLKTAPTQLFRQPHRERIGTAR
jgi:uncharacterized protein (DUF2267 family)